MRDREDTRVCLPTRTGCAPGRCGFFEAGTVGALVIAHSVAALAQGKCGGHLSIGIADGASTGALDSATTLRSSLAATRLTQRVSHPEPNPLRSPKRTS